MNTIIDFDELWTLGKEFCDDDDLDIMERTAILVRRSKSPTVPQNKSAQSVSVLLEDDAMHV